MQKASKKQNLLVIVGAIVLVLCAIGTTVYVTRTMQGLAEANQEGYQNVTFTDAVLACEDQGRADFANDLSQLVVDRHSSRYDNSAFTYKIFLMAYTEKADNEIGEFFITCYVRSLNGRISKFEVFENVESNEGGAIKQGGEKFIEWPH